MKVQCICFLILSTTYTHAYEHVVVKGDSLWSLSKRHLGSGSKWTEITYKDGSYPNEYDLTIGRTLNIASPTTPLFNQAVVGNQGAVNLVNEKVQPTIKQKKQTAPLSSSQPALAFNTSVYCCASQTVVMNEFGGFEVAKEDHPFYVQEKPNTQQKMAKFMNIRISEELLDAFNDN